MAAAMIQRLGGWYRSHVSYLTLTPILVTWAIIIASFIIGMVSARNVESVQNQAVDKQLRENALVIQSAFGSYEQIVWSGVGRVNSAPIDRSSWSAFVNTYQLPKRFPALSRLAVTKVVRPEEKDAILKQLSAQYEQPINVINESSSHASNIVAYSAPEQPTTRHNIGFNVWSNDNRLEATNRATDTNTVAMTDQIELVSNAQNRQTSQTPAFILYAPYYTPGAPIDTVEQRRQALQGHIFASFQTKKVFEQIFDRLDKSYVSVQVTTKDGHKSNKDVVYRSQATRQTNSKIGRSQEVNVYGQTFGVEYEFDRSFLVSTAQLNAPLYTALFGSLVGLLVGTVTFFFLRGRYHQVLLDKERDIANAKDELLSLASHQLRTPATGVKQYVGMVVQGFAGPISEVQREMLTKAYKSNERQLRVINDILHLAKLDMGRIVLAKTNFDLSELITDVVDEQRQDIEAGELKIIVKVLKRAPVYADKHMLRMVIENLLSNAVKYTGPGGKITIRLQRKQDEYYITVQDTGVGIDPKDLPLLFRQFSRIRNPRSHLVTGTGVGLYLAKHLARLHGGDIIAESTEGVGSSFVVFIPKRAENV